MKVSNRTAQASKVTRMHHGVLRSNTLTTAGNKLRIFLTTFCSLCIVTCLRDVDSESISVIQYPGWREYKDNAKSRMEVSKWAPERMRNKRIQWYGYAQRMAQENSKTCCLIDSAQKRNRSLGIVFKTSIYIILLSLSIICPSCSQDVISVCFVSCKISKINLATFGKNPLNSQPSIFYSHLKISVKILPFRNLSEK